VEIMAAVGVVVPVLYQVNHAMLTVNALLALLRHVHNKENNAELGITVVVYL
jgi:hypothetical protein